MFVHHVFFWLKSPVGRQALANGLKTLEEIEPKILFHIGEPAETRREVIDSSYDFSLLIIFDNRSDQDVYQEHPIHNKFVKQCSALWSKVVVYDSIEK